MKKETFVHRMLSLLLCLAMVVSIIPMVPAAAEEAEIADASACGSSHGEFTAVSGSVAPSSFADGGNFRLTGDTNLTGQVTIGAGKSLHLDLNGFSLTTGGTTMFLLDGKSASTPVKLTVCDSSQDASGRIDMKGADAACIDLTSHAVFTLYGGTITGVKSTTGKYPVASRAASCTANLFGGTISGNQTTLGCVMVSAGTLNMTGGAISGNTTTGTGGGVYMGSANAVMKLSGGVISDNTSGTHGGAIYMSGGTVTMTGGSIVRNQAGSAAGYGGGAVLMQAGSLTMTGGTISDNKAMQGGAFYINKATSSVTVSGDAVLENNTTNLGGAVFCSNGFFTMTGGTVRGNEAARGGAFYGENITVKAGTVSGNQAQYGGVVFHSGDEPVEFAGGTFTDNLATLNGAVAYSNGYTNQFPQFRVTGGTITGNRNGASANGTDSFILSGTDFIMTGGTIDGNFSAKEEPLTLKLHNYQKASAGTFSGKAVVGDGGVVCSKEASGVPASQCEVYSLKKGASILSQSVFTYNTEDYTVQEEIKDGKRLYSYNPEIPSEHAANWTPLEGEITSLEAGQYALSDDLILKNTITIDGDVSICLDSKLLSGLQHPYFKITETGSLTICDCGRAKTGTVDGSTLGTTASFSGGFVQSLGGEFTMNSGTITGFKGTGSGSVVYASSTSVTTFNGGTITGNSGGNGIVRLDGGQLNFAGGLFTGNEAANGTLVFANGQTSTTAISVSGGTFTKNKASASGLIHSNGATVLISDGLITENYSKGAVCFLQATDLTISGGTIAMNLDADGKLVQRAVQLSDHYADEAKDSTAVFTGTAVVLDGGVYVLNDGSKAEVKALEAGAMITAASTLTTDSSVRTVKGAGSLVMHLPKDDTIAADHTDARFVAGSVTGLTSGTIVLAGDTFLGGGQTLTGNMTLCLNGYRLTGSGAPYFTVPSGKSLTICDCSEAGTGTIDGSTIVNNQAYGLINVSTGTVKMTGGTITGNNTTTRGGAIYAAGKSEVTLSDVTLTGNTTGSHGSAIYFTGAGTLKMDGCTVTKNTGEAGTVIAYDTAVTVKDSTFTGNRARGGAVVQVNRGTLNMEGVTVSDNTANAYAVVCSGADLTMKNCSVERNDAISGSLMGQISISKYSGLTTVPKAVITGSTFVDRPGVRYNSDGTTVTVKELTRGAMICGSAKALTVGDDTVEKMGDWYLSKADLSDAHTDAAPLRGSLSTLAAGKYFLVGDVHLEKMVTLTGEVTLCLNGYTITGEIAPYFYVNAGCHLTVCDHSADESGKIDGSCLTESSGNGLVQVRTNGSFTLKSGSICNHASKSAGGAVYVVAQGRFYMEGGTIYGNSGTRGGAVYVYGNNADSMAYAQMSGGKIEGNVADYGAAFYGNYAQLTITGGVICENAAKMDGSVAYGNFVVYDISGGTMTENETVINTIVAAGGQLKMSGGRIDGNMDSDQNGPATAIYLNTYGTDGPSEGIISGKAVIGDKGLQLYDDTVICTIGKLDRREARVISQQKLEDLQDGTVYLGEDPDTGYFLYTGATSTTPHEGWTELTGEEPVSELPAGSYYLGRDVVLTDTVTLDGDLQICLNGFDLLGEKAPFFVVPEGTRLTVCDHSKLGDGALNGEGKSSLVQVTGGTFEVQGGGVKNTTGNAVEVTGGEMILSGGTMQENETAIYASGTEQAPVSVTLSGGKLTNNETDGAVIDARYADVILSGCTVSANKAENVVYAAEGTLTVSGGSFSNNTAKAVLAAEHTLVTANGGKVRSNEGSALTMTGGSAKLSGGVVLEDGGIVLEDGAEATIQSLKQGGSIYAPAEAEGLTVVEGDTILTTQLDSGLVCYSYKYEKSTVHSGWKPIGGEVTELASGSYYLTEAATVGSGVTITGTVELCLGGKTVTGTKAPYFIVAEGGSLTICDHSVTGTGALVGSHLKESVADGLVWVQAGGSFVLQSGSIYGHISEKNGGAVVVEGSFTMEGGRIHTNETGKKGGAIYAVGTKEQNASVTISGGTIENNKAKSGGSVLYAKFAEVLISGGTMTKNIASSGYTVEGESCTFGMTGGTIFDNTNASDAEITAVMLTSALGGAASNAVLSGSAVLGDKGMTLFKGASGYVSGLTEEAEVISVNALHYDADTVQMTEDIEYSRYVYTMAVPERSGVTITAADVTIEDHHFWLSADWVKKSQQLTAVLDEGITVPGKKLNWYSSNTKVATISASGKVTYRGPGTTEITVRVLDAYDQDTGYFGKVTVTVGEEPLRVLALGNPSTRDALMYLSDLALLTGNRIELGIAAPSSAALREHAYFMAAQGGSYSYYLTNPDTGAMTVVADKSTTVDYILKDKEWDVILLNHGQVTLGYRGTYSQDVQYIIDYFSDKEPNAKLYWSMGWAIADGYDNTNFKDHYGSSAAMYNSIVRCMEEFLVGDETRYGPQLEGYVAVGAALQKMREAGFEITRNKIDLSYEAGRLTAAMTTLATLLPDADLNLITPSGLSGFLSEYDTAMGKYAPDLYENTVEDLNTVKAAVEEAVTDAREDKLPELIEQPQWERNDAEGVILVDQAYAPQGHHFPDVTVTEDGTVFVTSYENVGHTVYIAGSGSGYGMVGGEGRVLLWKGHLDENDSFVMEETVLTVDEDFVEQTGIFPQMFDTYDRLRSGAATVKNAYVECDPRDPNIKAIMVDMDGDGQLEEVLFMTVWIRYHAMNGEYTSVLYGLWSMDNGETWSAPFSMIGTYGGVKRGDVTWTDNNQLLVPTYGVGVARCLHLQWDIQGQKWNTLGHYEIPNFAKDEEASLTEVSLISPEHDNVIYAFIRPTGSVIRSEDYGKIWEEIGNESGEALQPGWAQLDENWAVATWSVNPAPRSTCAKLFNFHADWMDAPTNLVYKSGSDSGADTADPSCAMLPDGRVIVVHYDMGYHSILANIIDPRSEEYLPYELKEGSSHTLTYEAQISEEGVLLEGDTLTVGEKMDETHTVWTTAEIGDGEELTIHTRNGDVVVTNDRVIYGDESAALVLEADVATTVRISMVGKNLYMKIWQGGEPENWTLEAVGEMDGGVTTLSGDGVRILSAKITRAALVAMDEAITVEVAGALGDAGFTAMPLEDEVIWTSSDPTVAVGVNGKIAGRKEGTATVTATIGDVSISCEVTVVEAPQEINPNYEREILLTDDFEKYTPGMDTFWEYHWENLSDSLYRFREKNQEDKSNSVLYKIRKDDRGQYLVLSGTTWHMTKRSFEGPYTVQFDLKFKEPEEIVNITLWQNDFNISSVYAVHAFVNIKSGGARFQYRPMSPQKEPDALKNPNTNYPVSPWDIAKGEIGIGVWNTVKIARVDGAMYLKIWNREEQEPENWNEVLRADVLTVEDPSFFRMQFVGSYGGELSMDNLIISRATDVLADVPDEPVEPEDPEIPLFDGFMSRMVLGNALELQVGVPKAAMEDWTGAYAEVTFKGETTVVPYEDWGAAGPYYALTVKAAAKEMNEEATVQIFNSEGQAVSVEYTDSIRGYAERNYDAASDEDKTLLVDMLNYGAEAQIYFDYMTDDLANAGLTEEQQAMATETVECTNGLAKGENYLGSRLVLKSNLSLQLAFKNVDESCYAVYTYTNHYGNEKTVTVDGADFIDGYGVEISELVLADAKQLVTCTVYNAEDEAIASVTDSVESYIARMSGESDLHDAIMKFATSAYNKFH